jgi:hypothetical protein
MPPYGRQQHHGEAEERLARALAAERARLLRRHAHRLERADLEECLAQAALELVPRARREAVGSAWRPALDLEQRFLARVTDRRRALAGRSPRERLLRTAATIGDANLDEVLQVADARASVDEQVWRREELRRLLELIAELSDDQRMVAIHRLFGDVDAARLRQQQQWSVAKYEKLASRARARLTALRAEYDSGERCRRLAPDLHAAVFGGATAEQRARAARHVRNCRRCARSTMAARRLRRRRTVERAADRGPVVTPLAAAIADCGFAGNGNGRCGASGCPACASPVGSADVSCGERSAEWPC